MKRQNSEQLYRRACESMPGGVNSPVRAFRAVGGTPPFIRSGKGGRFTDVDGNEYVDFVGSWGPLILGHAHPAIVSAIQTAAARGTTFGAPTQEEVVLAERIREGFPSMQMLRLVSSGTEATMSALRVARGFTGRNNIIKFIGCYHGHHDSLLTAAGSGVATFDLPDSAGVPAQYSSHTISVAYNDLEGLRSLPKEILRDTAAVILEPVAANMGLVPPAERFLQGLRDFTRKRSILLIFDEVISGFRLCFGGAQKLYGIEPDLTCLGKIVGGGMPLAAYGGRADIMQKVAPLGPVYQAGTLAGNPVAASAGLAALNLLREPDTYERLEGKARTLLDPIQKHLSESGHPVSLSRLGSMFTFFFRRELPSNFAEAKECDTKAYARFFWKLMDDGVYTACSQFETNFVSLAHTGEDLVHAQKAILKALEAVN
ncbi:MAG TPA: glutamate-1-semialdehyde 2,1-aminomutase [Acidobacteriota bacterium]|nr:glutamate-1-semialdehyde 2,1-aminomutase [Acidobacteriota bacterium]